MRANLSGRMLAAAETIQELNTHYQYNTHTPWEPSSLRHEASIVADEETQAYAP